ncbi:hypothetical protein BASA81_000248 [Batrachochytrium salamandrivorans]|nr:hypothetical protein BASA81_000248 [Batrachochytrium salamandrivorans]
MSSKSKFVIVGAGSAGCTLARRILEFDPQATVKLIETGKQDRHRFDSWTIRMPSALTYNVADTRYNYDYYTVPQPHLGNRKIHEPRGKVVGGSSNINAMVYIRGHRLDFDRWAQEVGSDEWKYANVLPYFKRAQNHSLGGNLYRGVGGPLQVRACTSDTVTNELFNVFCEAGVQAGYPRTDDVNGKDQLGFGPFDMTIAPNGVRCSASVAYLHSMPKEMSTRLQVVTERTVTKILFQDGKRATGVLLDDGQVLEAESEVILSAGAVGSPQLLMLSGVGPKDHLKQVGIQDVVLDNEHVGSNLQDHLEVYLQYKCKKPVTLFPIGNWSLRYLHRRIKVGLDWFLFGTGVAASNQFEMGAFVSTNQPGVLHPDIQYHFIPGAVLGQLEFLPYHAFQIHVGTLRPTSRGSLRLRTNNAMDAPLIDPNFLATERDMQDMRIATRLANELIHQPAFNDYYDGFIRPQQGFEVLEDDTKLDEWIRASSHSAYHLSCTCAMGKVVDEHGLVYGLQGLRVVDASIMPSMTSGNLNAPTIMLAEKIADHICHRAPLPPILDA